jgi:hypothetical protein
MSRLYQILLRLAPRRLRVADAALGLDQFQRRHLGHGGQAVVQAFRVALELVELLLGPGVQLDVALQIDDARQHLVPAAGRRVE